MKGSGSMLVIYRSWDGNRHADELVRITENKFKEEITIITSNVKLCFHADEQRVSEIISMLHKDTVLDIIDLQKSGALVEYNR